MSGNGVFESEEMSETEWCCESTEVVKVEGLWRIEREMKDCNLTHKSNEYMKDDIYRTCACIKII